MGGANSRGRLERPRSTHLGASTVQRGAWACTRWALGLSPMLWLLACGTDPVGGGTGQEHLGTTQQAITVPPDSFSSETGVTVVTGGIEIADDGIAVYDVTLAESGGQYAVSYEIERADADSVVLTLLSATDVPLGSVSVAPGAPAKSPPRIFVTHTAGGPGNMIPSGSQTLKLKAEVNGTSPGGPVTVYTIRIQPLRTAALVDPETDSFAGAQQLCQQCHGEQYAQWRSSMMGYSSISPPIHALELTENHVERAMTDSQRAMGSGRLARTAAAPINATHAESQLFCQKCHAPVAVFTDAFRVFDIGSNDFTDDNRGAIPDSHRLLRQIMGVDAADVNLLRNGVLPTGAELALLQNQALLGTEGVTCTVCHSINGRDTTSNAPNDGTTFNGPRPNFEEGVANSAFLIMHNDPGSAPVNLGPYGDQELTALHPTGQSGGDGDETLIPGTDGKDRPFIQSGEFCGTCHDVRIPFPDEGLDGDFGTPDDADFRRVENLFTEWRDGPWNNRNTLASTTDPNKGAFENPGRLNDLGLKSVTSCQDCHMSRFVTDDTALPGQYDMGIIGSGGTEMRRRSNHRFIGVDRFLTHDMPMLNTPGSNQALKPFDISQRDQDLAFSSDLAPGNSGRDLREILLQKAIDFKIEHVGPVEAGQLPIRISVENVGAAHNIPSGLSQERQIWIELEVLDASEDNVYTTGYLNFIEGPEAHNYDPFGLTRYKDSACATQEYKCDLDGFRLTQGLGPFLNILPDNTGITFDEGDTQLKNYQNGFTFDGQKVFTQFIGDHIVNTNSLKPFEKQVEQYTVNVGPRVGPFKVNARLRFRPLPFEFLNALEKSVDCAAPGAPVRCYPSRVTEDVIEKNIVIEMEQDGCVAGAYGLLDERACSRVTREPLALGENTTCAVFDADSGNQSGSVQCFGANASGEVGIGVGPTAVTAPAVLTLLDVTMTSLGDSHGCALLNDGTVSCWGDGTGGKLADGDTASHQRTAPRLVAATSLDDVAQIASGGSTTCALSIGKEPGDERVRCWGQSTHGELGDGNPSPHDLGVPALIPASSLPGAESIVAGKHHYCAISQDSTGVRGKVQCWGQAEGVGQGSDVAVPTLVPLIYRANQLAAGDSFTCALTASSEVYCWGDNTYGNLGNGNTTASLTPVKVELPDGNDDPHPTAIAAGDHHACALLSDETLKCWGLGDNGRLGDDNLTSHIETSPVPVLAALASSFLDVAFVAAGGSHTCAMRTTGERYCWGANSTGQLGLGSTTDVAVAELVAFADPTVTGRTYYATASQGGFGTAACAALPGFGVACDDIGTYIDLNDNTGYQFTIQSDGGPTQLFPKIGVNSGTRSMDFYVDNVLVQQITSDPIATPRPAGAEVGPITVNLVPGYHSVEFRDIGPSSAELDVLSLRVAGEAGANHCYDLTQSGSETDVDCGGSCGPCGDDKSCVTDADCQSGDCDAGTCQAFSSPCAALCANPQAISFTWNYQSGNLGTGPICLEVTQTVDGGNCGNFSGGRTLSVNGVQMPCNNQNWSFVPAPIGGGYCVQATAGDFDYAYVTLFD